MLYRENLKIMYLLAFLKEYFNVSDLVCHPKVAYFYQYHQTERVGWAVAEADIELSCPPLQTL